MWFQPTPLAFLFYFHLGDVCLVFEPGFIFLFSPFRFDLLLSYVWRRVGYQSLNSVRCLNLKIVPIYSIFSFISIISQAPYLCTAFQAPCLLKYFAPVTTPLFSGIIRFFFLPGPFPSHTGKLKYHLFYFFKKIATNLSLDSTFSSSYFPLFSALLYTKTL